ncbi:hypothetical protein [Sphingomonas oryzagri]
MIGTQFHRIAADKSWSEARQIAVLLPAIGHHATPDIAAAVLAEIRSLSGDTVPDSVADRFMWDVVALIGNPGLVLSAAFQGYCLNSWNLLTPEQAGERWCCWNAA